MPYLLQVLCLMVIVAGCLFITWRSEWRLMITAISAFMATQFAYLYFVSGALISGINLLIGSMAVGILGYSCYHNQLEDVFDVKRMGTVFRLFSEFFVILSGFALSYKALSWLTQLPYTQISAGLVLMLTAIFMLNTFMKSWQVVLSLLIFLIGFEIIYFGLERSLLVTLLLGGVKIAVALTGSYLITSPRQDNIV